MTNDIIAVIGAGNMGTSIIGGLLQDGHPAENIIAANSNEKKCQQIEDTFHIQATTSNVEAAAKANVILLSVKPQILMSVCKELADTIKQQKALVLSVVAGVSEASILKQLGEQTAIVRVMPNTPSLIGCGASALFANAHVSKEQRNLAESIMRAVGVVAWVENEDQIDTATALSGSGPAYFFLIMEALQQAAESLGLPKDTSRLLAMQTALGASRLAMESDVGLEELRKRVTSPGGTTEKGISALESAGIRDTLKQALIAAKNRSKELAKEFGENQ